MTELQILPAAPEDRARRRWLGVAAFVIVAAIIGIGLWLSLKTRPEQVQAMVDADEIIVSAKVAGRVERLYVAEGDRVAAGQLLFTLTGPEIAAKRGQAEAVIAAAQAQSTKAKNGARSEEIETARANAARAQAGAALAEVTYTRTQNLYAEGVVAAQRRDEALANSKSAREAAAAARSQYAQAQAGARIEDIETVGAQVRQAQAALAEVAAAEAETRIGAPSAGYVTRKMADVGELVAAGYPVFTLTDIDHAWVALNLREDQLRGLKPGSVIAGTVPALADRRVRFRVYFVNPAGDYATWRATRQSSGYDIKSFEVRARPVDAAPGLRPGMSVLFDSLAR
jgi:HlyD family secretion protein